MNDSFIMAGCFGISFAVSKKNKKKNIEYQTFQRKQDGKYFNLGAASLKYSASKLISSRNFILVSILLTRNTFSDIEFHLFIDTDREIYLF